METSWSPGSLAASIWGINSSSDRPSIFELMLMEQLSGALYPAYRAVSDAFRRRFASLSIATTYGPETYALIMFFVQRYFLTTHGSSLTEYMYGLKRVVVPSGGLGRQSTRRRPIDVNVALFCLIAVPYVARRADEYFAEEAMILRSFHGNGDDLRDIVDDDDDDEETRKRKERAKNDRRRRRRRALLLKIYRVVRTSALSACALYKLGYSIDRTEFFSPLLAYAGTALRRVTVADIRRRREQLRRVHAARGVLGKSRSWLSWTFQKLTTAIQTSLMFSAILFKFFEWWYAPSNAEARERALRRSRGNSSRTRPPPPPTCPEGLTPLRRAPRDCECPLCGRRIRNPALSSSGALFCYTCITHYAREHGRCPLTKMPCTEGQIRRVRGAN